MAFQGTTLLSIRRFPHHSECTREEAPEAFRLQRRQRSAGPDHTRASQETKLEQDLLRPLWVSFLCSIRLTCAFIPGHSELGVMFNSLMPLSPVFSDYFPRKTFHVEFQVALNMISRSRCRVQCLCAVLQANLSSRRSWSRWNILEFERTLNVGLSLDEVRRRSLSHSRHFRLVLESCITLGGTLLNT